MIHPTPLKIAQPSFNAQSLTTSQRTVSTGFRSKNTLQSHTDTFRSVRFEGRGQRWSRWSMVLAFLTWLPSLTGSAARIQPPAAQQPAVGIIVQTRQDLLKDPHESFQSFQALLAQTEALPLGAPGREDGINTLTAQWEQLRHAADNGSLPALQLLQALTVKQIYAELETPSPQLIRFHYVGFNELSEQLKNNEITREQFNTELQGRALLGLDVLDWQNITQNPFLTNEEKSPTKAIGIIQNLLATNSHDRIQRNGHNLRMRLLGQQQQISPEMAKTQQQHYIEQTIKQFQTSAPGNEKYYAMKALTQLFYSGDRLTNPDLDRSFQDLIQQTRANLQDPTQQDALQYNIYLLMYMTDTETGKFLPSLFTPDAPLEAQQAITWALGVQRSNEALQTLLSIANNNRLDPAVREMAIYAMAQYDESDTTCIIRPILHQFAYPAGEGMPDRVQNAAKAMELKFLEEEKNAEPDFYINVLLQTPEEKTEYLALRNQYVQLDEGVAFLEPSEWNNIDKVLIPARHLLQELIDKGAKITLTTGEESSAPSNTGMRTMDGRSLDQVDAYASSNKTVVPAWTLTMGPDTFAHEFTHVLHLHIWDDNKDSGTASKIEDLYNAGNAREHYGKSNKYEYAAQGNEALHTDYLRNYMDYMARVFDGGFHNSNAHTTSDLKHRDPELDELLREEARSMPALHELPQISKQAEQHLELTCK